jgi:membrane protease YdiL (CAAX protease family)
VLAFFVLAFALTWPLQLALLRLPPAFELPLLAVAGCGPTLAALLLARPRRALLGPTPRAHPGWLLLALALPSVLMLAAGARAWSAPLLGPALLPPLGEELGWRGYALPRLARRFGWRLGSVIVGVAWGLWHLPTSLLPGGELARFPAFVVGVAASSVVIGWLWQRTGSTWVAVAFHAGLNLGIVRGASQPAWLLAWVSAAAVAALLPERGRARLTRPIEDAAGAPGDVTRDAGPRRDQ